MKAFDAQYSALDRLLHEMAFAGPGLQCAVADIEDIVFARRFSDIRINKPVFITSLPRAGTTLLLEMIAALPEFAAHTYRDMPFVLCPMSWDAISAKFRRPPRLRERAHGDGLNIGYDSPEAFEEILWRTFWPERYLGKNLAPWSSADKSGFFEVFFRTHMKKIIALRRGHGISARYVSKNNANIMRPKLLTGMFPDSIILVPFRHPCAQADSLWRMHKRFSQMHEQQPFVHRYMEHLGHYEFGKALRPIDFDGWLQNGKVSPASGDFWLAYWVAAFRNIVAQGLKNVFFISYENCCANPVESFKKIAEVIEIAPSETLLSLSEKKYRAPRLFEFPHFTRSLVEEAVELHQLLSKDAVV